MMWRTLLFVAGLAIAQPALAQQDDLAEALALPVASSLTGARDAPRFAWVENAAGVRNVWAADAGKPARQVTSYTEDGPLVYDVTLSTDGAHLAWVRGGDDEFPDGSLPNAGSAGSAPPQEVFLDGTRIGDGHAPAFDPGGSASPSPTKAKYGCGTAPPRASSPTASARSATCNGRPTVRA